VKKNQPDNIDLQLPGWGSWGGKNIKPSSRKKRRFIIKMPQAPPRRDENKGDVVIIEERCPKIRKHLVSELPFPFTTVQDFEASIRAPLGRDFVPEKTFSKLIQPAIKTKMGKVIEPMSEDVLVNVNNPRNIKLELQKKEMKDEMKTKKQLKDSKRPTKRKNSNKQSTTPKQQGPKLRNGPKAPNLKEQKKVRSSPKAPKLKERKELNGPKTTKQINQNRAKLLSNGKVKKRRPNGVKKNLERTVQKETVALAS
jgi:hypothetical protein